MVNSNIQFLSNREKGRYLNKVINKANNNLVFYWHYETIKQDFKIELFNNKIKKDNVK